MTSTKPPDQSNWDMTRPKLPAWKKLLFSATTVVMLFGVLEGLARIARLVRDPYPVRVGKYTVSDPVLHHNWIPSTSMLDDDRTVPYIHHVNKQAWVEEYDVSQKKPHGVYRIFMVGDSNTQGVVATTNKWVKIVERRLNEASSGVRYEVIDAGRSSYSPLLYYLEIKLQILTYHPDLVVINLDMTDVRDDAVYQVTMRTDAAGDIVAVTPSSNAIDTHDLVMTPEGVRRRSAGERLGRWCVERSVFLKYFQNAIQWCTDRSDFLRYAQNRLASAASPTRVRHLPPLNANWLAQEWSPEIEQHVAFSMSVLARTFDYLRQHHVKVMVTTIPHYPQFTGSWSVRPHEVVARFAREHDVPFLNGYKVLRTRIEGSRQPDFYWDNDPTHFNIEGNKLLAEAYLNFFANDGRALLPTAVRPTDAPKSGR